MQGSMPEGGDPASALLRTVPASLLRGTLVQMMSCLFTVYGPLCMCIIPRICP